MPLSDLPRIPQDADLTRVVDYLIMLQRKLNDFLNHLDTLNVEELDANVILANTITADKLSVTELSAISANLGSITAGSLDAVSITGSTITGGTLQTAETLNDRIVISGNALSTINSNNFSHGPCWGHLFGTGYGDMGFFDEGAQTAFMYNLGGQTGWQLGPDSAATLYIGKTGLQTTGVGNWSLPSSTNIGSVSSTEISYLDGVTSGIQSQLNGKAPSFSGYTGSVTVVTSVDFTGSTTTTSTLNFSNGVLTSVT